MPFTHQVRPQWVDRIPAVVHVDGSARIQTVDRTTVPTDAWATALDRDLATLDRDVAATEGNITVPLSTGRRPTDWERNVRRLEAAQWATADMAYRRDVPALVGGFGERFARAFREDADLGLRVTEARYRIVRGTRRVLHPCGRPTAG